MAWDASFKRPPSTRSADSAISLPISCRRVGSATTADNLLAREPSHEPLDMAPAATTTTTVLSPIVEEAARGSAAAPLAVRVQVRFADPVLGPIAHPYVRDYASSAAFEPSLLLCKGLLRRIEHCSEELITRRDPGALVHRLPGQAPRSPCYEMVFTILRPGEVWAERTFTSYQRQPLTQDCASEILLSTHRMIGLFLRQHDRGFRLVDEPVGDRRTLGRVTPSSLLSLGEPLPLACVPSSRFLEASQTFQFVPGYRIQFSFRSSSRLRSQREWARTLNLKSRQDAPLNLAQSENLLWAASDVVNAALNAKKREIDFEHHSCEWLEGPVDCGHFEENALEIDIRVENSLGPVYEHLARSIRTKLSLFRDPDGEDCYSFLRDVQAGLLRLRDKADDQVSQMNDFELRIMELRGPGWRAERPAKFTLDGTVTYSQRSIEAILDRVQSGIAEVLRGDDAAVHIVAYKRGHLVLDKALVARTDGRRPKTPAGLRDIDAEKAALVSRLETRIRQDLDKILKDTCSFSDLADDPPAREPESKSSGEHQPAEVVVASPPVSAALAVDHQPAEIPAEAPRPSTPTAQIPSSQEEHEADAAPAPATPSPRVFPLVPSKYNASQSRLRSGSTISSLSEKIPAPAAAEIEVASPTDTAIDTERLPELQPSALPATTAATAVDSAPGDFESKDRGAAELSDPRQAVTEASPLSNETGKTIAEPHAEPRTGDAVEVTTPQSSRPSTADGGESAEESLESASVYETGHESGGERPGVSTLAIQGAGRLGCMPQYDASVPSTPGLSHGDEASPRHSLLVTPTYMRTLSGGVRTIFADDMLKDGAEAGLGGYSSSNPDEDGPESPTAVALLNKRNSKTVAFHTVPEASDMSSPMLEDGDGFAQSKATFDFEDLELYDSRNVSSRTLPPHEGVVVEDASAEVVPALIPLPPSTDDLELEGAALDDEATSYVPSQRPMAATVVDEAEEVTGPATPVLAAGGSEGAVLGSPFNPRPSLRTSATEPAPVGDGSILLPRNPRPAVRNSVSSWEDYVSMAARDSVDTVKSDVDGADPVARPPTPQRRKSISTAGYLGLQQAGMRVGLGLRDALVGPRHWFEDRGSNRPSTPSKSVPNPPAAEAGQPPVAGDEAAEPTAPRTPTGSISKSLRLLRPNIVAHRRTASTASSSSKTSLFKKLPKAPRRRAKSSSSGTVLEEQVQATGEEAATQEEGDKRGSEDKALLPRFMMLFAGMAVASQVLHQK